MFRTLLLLVALVMTLPACAAQQCDFHSECGTGFYCSLGRCEQDCRRDVDCDPGLMCSVIGQCVPAVDGGRVDAATPRMDGAVPGLDAGPSMDSGNPRDAGPPGSDAGPGADAGSPGSDAGPPGSDAGPPGSDAGPPGGSGRYLDRCVTGTDCNSGRCVDNIGGRRMCTRACASHSECANGHLCDTSGQCVRGDVGAGCSLSSPATCATGNCLGRVGDSAGYCTRECVNAADCPAGYACFEGAPGVHVCADIERPCVTAADCVTGVCIPGIGCSSECRTAADCPARFYYLSPYTCEAGPTGSTICIPPSDILGSDPIGTTCYGFGDDTCRAGSVLTCDGTSLGNHCTQTCTERGGCADGLGCFPSIEDLGGGLENFRLCSQAGTRALGDSCDYGFQCDSGICDTALFFCTRLCTDDGLCPSDMTCRTILSGVSGAVCRR